MALVKKAAIAQVTQHTCYWQLFLSMRDRRYHPSPILLSLLFFTLTLCLTVLPAIAKAPAPAPLPLQAIASQSFFEQGTTLYQAGQFADAANAFQKAAQVYQTRGKRLKQAAAISNLSLAYQQLGRWQEARDSIAESLVLLNQTKEPSAQTLKLLAQALHIQAGLELATGQSDRALATWQRVTLLYTQIKDETGVFRSRINQAKTLQIKGFYRRALDILSDLNQTLASQPDSLTKAVALRSLGDALQLTNKLEPSRQVLQQSLVMAQRLQSPEDISAAYLSLGNTARVQNDTASAISAYQNAIANSVNLLLKAQAQINYLSLLAEATPSDHAFDAIQLVDQIQVWKLPPNRESLFAKINYAQAVSQLMDKAEISQPVAAAIPRLTQSVVTLLASAIEQAQILQDSIAEAYALGTLGHLYEQRQQWAQAQQLTEQAVSRVQSLNAPEVIPI